MLQHARVTDVFVGTCCCCGCAPMAGTIVTSASRTDTENLTDARLTDIGIGYCGHPTALVTSSGTVTIENLKNTRITDAVAGCIIGAMVTSASRTSNTN